MKEWIIKLAVRVISGIDSPQFEQVVEWVVEAGQNTVLRTGWEEASYVVAKYNKEFAETANFVVRTVVQIAYFIARVRGLDT